MNARQARAYCAEFRALGLVARPYGPTGCALTPSDGPTAPVSHIWVIEYATLRDGRQARGLLRAFARPGGYDEWRERHGYNRQALHI